MIDGDKVVIWVPPSVPSTRDNPVNSEPFFYSLVMLICLSKKLQKHYKYYHVSCYLAVISIPMVRSCLHFNNENLGSNLCLVFTDLIKTNDTLSLC